MLSLAQSNKELVRGAGGAIVTAGLVTCIQKLLESKAYRDAGDAENAKKAMFLGRVSLGMIFLGALAWGVGSRMK